MSEYEYKISIIPLNNFDSDIEMLKIGKKALLRRIDKNELMNLRLSFPHSATNTMLALTGVNYVLEIDQRMQVDNGSVVAFGHNLSDVRSIILALRLLKPGEVGVSCAFALSKNSSVFGLSGPSLLMHLTQPYFLSKGETARFVELWAKLQNVKSVKPHLDFPLKQFNRTFEEESVDDKIVGYMIALESLVFHREKKAIEPAGKVIGIATSMLIGKNQKERTEIKENLIKAYEVRNAKVHGNLEKLQGYRQEIGEISTFTEDYVRHALRILVEE